MPTYVYHCNTCDINFEKIQKFSDDPLKSCPEGHTGVRRVITPSAIIFKGAGWYITDSKNGGNKSVPSKVSETGEKADVKSDSVKSETSNANGKGESSTSKSDATATKGESKSSSEGVSSRNSSSD